MKKASALLLTSDEVPSLLLDGARVSLTMAPLTAGLLADLLGSVLGPAQREALARDGSVEDTYSSQQHGSYAVRAQASDGKVTLTLTGDASAATGPALDEPRVAPGTVSAGGLESILDQAVARGASDVLLSADTRPLLRVDGSLIELRPRPSRRTSCRGVPAVPRRLAAPAPRRRRQRRFRGGTRGRRAG